MKKTKQLLLILLFAAVTSSTAFAQGEKASSAKEPRKITFEMLVSEHNFPVKENSGNPELDQQKYAIAKKKWIAENQALYKKYNSQGVQGKPSQRKSSATVITPSN